MNNDPIEEVVETEPVVAEEEQPQDIDWRAEADKWKAQAQRYKKQASKAKEDPSRFDEISKDINELKMEKNKRTFGYEHGLSPDEVDAVFAFNPAPTKDILDNPFVKGGIDAIRAKKKVNEAIPAPTHAASKIMDKKFEELPADEKQAEWKKLTGRFNK